MIRIIEATPADYNIIQQLAYKIWPVTYGDILSTEQLDYMLDSFYSIESITQSVKNNQPFLLAIENQDCVGFISYEHFYKKLPVTRIHKIYVSNEIQGRGIGKMLFSEVELLAKAAKSISVSLNVNRFNNAQLFYLKMGFKIIKEEDISIGNGYLMEDYVMEKPLD